MEDFIKANYKSLYQGVLGTDIIDQRPKDMTDAKFYKELNKYCGTSRIGMDRKKMYKLMPEYAVRFCPNNLEYFKNGSMTELDMKIGAIFDYNLDIKADLSMVSHQRKLEVMFCELIRFSLCGKHFIEKEHMLNAVAPFNVFTLKKEDWETGFKGEADEWLPNFNANHSCKLTLRAAAFHKTFETAMEKCKSLPGVP